MNFDRSMLPPADFEFVVVGDTHFIQDAEAYAIEFDSVRQWPRRAAWALQCVAELETDLVIHLGDLSEEPPGHAHHEASRDTALKLMDELGLQPRFVAGNMDIGDKPDPTMFTPPVHQDTLEWFHRRFGPTWNSFDRGGCHFVLLNSQILNGDLPAVQTQARWLEQDLAAHAGRRILLFLHMPPFFVAEDEPDTGFYNSIDEPARSWLCHLTRKYDIESIFCGHTHFRALNRIGNARVHVCPSTTTSRAGFYEAFTVAPPPEQGRNDPDKLGFYLVRIMADGVRPYFIRTAGATGPCDHGARLLTRTSADLGGSPLGLNLRSPLAIEAAGALAWPSVKRQRVRDDHPLLSALEFGVRHVRVPESDLNDPLQAERLRVLRDEGVGVTAQYIWSPTLDLPGRVAAAEVQPDVVELQTPGVVLPGADILDALRVTGDACNCGLSMAPLLPHERVPGRYHPRGRLGFHTDELSDLEGVLADAGVALQRCLCVVDSTDPWTSIAKLPEPSADIRGVDIIYALDGAPEPDRAWQLTRAIAAAAVRESTHLFLDPFVDLDRTNDLRPGLLDRLGNPHPLFHVAACLNTLLFAEAGWTVTDAGPNRVTLAQDDGRSLRLGNAVDAIGDPSGGVCYHLETGTRWSGAAAAPGPVAMLSAR
jgi:predicted phosphodiesterase